MSDFTFTCTQGSVTRTVEFTEEYLPHVLEEIELFLKGCGYVFDGVLDIVNEESQVTETSDADADRDYYVFGQS